MSSPFTREQVRAVAALAHLDLDEAEIDLFARQLGDILEYARHVQEIDTTGIEPTTTVAAGGDAVGRPDTVRPSLDPQTALANAPEAAPDAGLFKVPRVLG